MTDEQVIYFLVGIPGSGKSTFARKYVDEHPGLFVRVNKDDLRRMLHDGKWSKGNEKVVEMMERMMAEEALAAGLSVIVDNTHLSSRHEVTYRKMADDFGVKFEMIGFDLPIEDCIERDLKRPNPVGKDVILKMFYQSLPKVEPVIGAYLSRAIICDLDGTLAKTGGRRGPFEWDRVGQDDVNGAVKLILAAFDSDKWLSVRVAKILVSGRDECCRDATVKWLYDNNIGYDQLFMRPANNKEKDTVVKRRIYDENIKDKFNVLFVFDDRPCCVRLWRSLGLFVFDCGLGYEF